MLWIVRMAPLAVWQQSFEGIEEVEISTWVEVGRSDRRGSMLHENTHQPRKVHGFTHNLIGNINYLALVGTWNSYGHSPYDIKRGPCGPLYSATFAFLGFLTSFRPLSLDIVPS